MTNTRLTLWAAFQEQPCSRVRPILLSWHSGKYGMRNKFEERVAEQLGEGWQYEAIKLNYIVPARKATYTPDFIDPLTKRVVETKGQLRDEDRKKMVLVKEQNPDWSFHFIFQNAKAKLRKGSKTTYADWAEKNGFTWEQGPRR